MTIIKPAAHIRQISQQGCQLSSLGGKKVMKGEYEEGDSFF